MILKLVWDLRGVGSITVEFSNLANDIDNNNSNINSKGNFNDDDDDDAL